jgi:hypothetical protein
MPVRFGWSTAEVPFPGRPRPFLDGRGFAPYFFPMPASASGFPARERDRRRRASALGAVLAALGYVAAQGAAFAHLLLVPHVRCAEHGELRHTEAIGPISRPRFRAALRHAADLRAVAQPAADARRERTHPPGDAPGRSGHGGGDHDHCGVRVVPVVAHDSVAPSLLGPWLACDTARAVPPAAGAARHVPIPLLHVAPKASPPLA